MCIKQRAPVDISEVIRKIFQDEESMHAPEFIFYAIKVREWLSRDTTPIMVYSMPHIL